ncbi:MAG: hypothetical protein HY900_08475, partial [Deltaproteobacteria bacterium]|nr:hypothetical protein [Deltaproteobacteria bacterium]
MPNPDAPPSLLRRFLARLAVLPAAPVLSLLAMSAFEPYALAQGSIIVDVDALPKATTSGPLAVLRVELAFDSGLPRATVPLNGRLRARADIRYTGNGPLTGRWLVDGRPLQTFNRTLTFGSSLVLETADLPPLPTFEPGYHDVTLQFSSPTVAFTAPTIRYFVEAAPGASQIALLQPLDGATLTRPRGDGLFPLAQQPLQFAWRLTTGLPNKGIQYRFSLFEPGSEATPSASALVTTWTYAMPTALAATLATGREYRWQVQVLDELGRVTATSEARRLTLRPASAIELVTPPEDGAVPLPQLLAWSSSRRLDGYEVRAYLNDTLLRQDLEQNVGVGSPDHPGGTLGQATGAALFAQTTERTGETLSRLRGQPQTPGLTLRWIVLGVAAGGNPVGPGATVVEASEIGTFHLAPAVESLSGLPRALLMGGFEIAVTSYETGATLASLSGRGTVRFVKDRSQTPIPLGFTNLRVEAFREQNRTVTGSGATERDVVSETLKGRVLEGRIAETYAPAVTLDLQGYAAELGGLTLAENPDTGGRASADLTLVLPGYAGAQPTFQHALPLGEPVTAPSRLGRTVTEPGAGPPLPLRVFLKDLALEPGGDFYQEVPGFLVSGVRSTQPTAAGLTLLGGSLVADFSTSRDFLGSNGQPVPREAGVFLMGGSAELAAASLFPVTAPASLHLAFQSLELKPGGLEGGFEVVGSDAIAPVVPADYHVSFTGGSVALAAGLLRADTLTLDGSAELPASVRSASGRRPTARFAQMRPNGAFLESQNVNLPELEWGPAGGTPFRVLDAGGQLLLPWGVISDSQRMGLRLWQKGTLDSPVRLLPDDVGQSTIQSTGPGTATTAAGTTGVTGSTAVRLNTQQGSTAPAPTIELNVRAGGVSGVYMSSRPHEGKL